MQCRKAEEPLSALIDGETTTEALAVAAHVAACPRCTERMRDYERIGEQLRIVAQVPAPADLADKIRSRLDREIGATDEKSPFSWRAFLAQAAVLIVVAALSSLIGWKLSESATERFGLERDIVAAHARSLLQDSAVQIASSQSHTVKPWFNGRIEFAPSVKDLTADGFPLVGGRLDFVGNRRVATLVYKRREHVINVFIWPAAAA